ncbi:MAG: hypothetical protein JWN74_3827 [Acidobacteriaceae bacterium]|nr:hypothetical protein [Acidobacteriaceae bacterium]
MFSPFRRHQVNKRWRRTLAAILLTVCGTVFITRGPFRPATASDLNDLISPYIQATALVHGADPYSAKSLLEFWPSDALGSRPDAQEFSDGSILIKHGVPTAYPLTSLLLLAPFTVLPWYVFKLLAISATIVLFFATVWLLIIVAELSGWRRLLFIAIALLFAPVHTGIATCNLAIIATELGVIALWANYTGREIESGLLIAICSGLKPQIGLCFLIYYIVRRQFRTLTFALGSLAAVIAIAVTRLAIAHVDWLPNYKLANKVLFSTGVLGDFTDRNPLRFGLVNLQVGLYAFMHSRQAANVSAVILSLLLFTVWVTLISKMTKRNDLLCLGALAALSLLPAYHRFYDAALLIIPLCYLLARSKSGFNRHSAIACLALVVFLVPGGSLLETLRNRGFITSVFSSTTWWNGLVMAHAVWCLLLLTLALLYEMACAARASTQSHQTALNQSKSLAASLA